MPPKPPKTFLQASEATLREAADGLRAQIKHVKAKLAEKREAGKTDTSLGSHLAFLTRDLNTIVGQARQLEKHDKEVVAALTPEQYDAALVHMVTKLPVERRAAVLEQLGASTDSGSVL